MAQIPLHLPPGRPRAARSLLLVFVLLVLTACAISTLPDGVGRDLDVGARRALAEYMEAPADFSAFGVDPEAGAWSWTNGEYSPQAAVARITSDCRRRGANCQVYALGRTVLSEAQQKNIGSTIANYQATVAASVGFRDDELQIGINEAKAAFLSGPEIKSRILGTDVEAITGNGFRANVKWMRNGTMSAVVELPEGYSGVPISDSGAWWTGDRSLCLRWNSWYRRSTICTSVLEQAGVFTLYDVNGYLFVRFVIS